MLVTIKNQLRHLPLARSPTKKEARIMIKRGKMDTNYLVSKRVDRKKKLKTLVNP